jgi:hypothetical protein
MKSTSESGLKISIVYYTGTELGDEGVPYLAIFRTIQGTYFMGMAMVVRNLDTNELEWVTYNDESARPYAYIDIPYDIILHSNFCETIRQELKKVFVLL